MCHLIYINNMKKGFTLIELLVVIAIIGLLAGVIFTTLTSVAYQARGSYVARTTESIEQAFILKGLDEGITQWWQVENFPIDSEWEEVIDINKLVEEGELGRFLPTLPEGLPSDAQDDFGRAPYDFTFAYQNYFPTASEYTDPDPSVCFQEDYTHDVDNFYDTQNGISIVVRPDYNFQTEKFRETFASLDAFYDDSDGQNCGNLRVITYPNWVAMFIITIDRDINFPH